MQKEIFVVAKRGVGIAIVRPRFRRTIFISDESITELENIEPEIGVEKVKDGYALICALFADAFVDDSIDGSANSFTALMSSGYKVSNADFAACVKVPTDIGGILKRSIDPLMKLWEEAVETEDLEEFVNLDFVD